MLKLANITFWQPLKLESVAFAKLNDVDCKLADEKLQLVILATSAVFPELNFASVRSAL